MNIPNPTGSNASSNTPPKRFHSVATVARLLEVSEKTVRRWIDAGDLPHHRLGRQIRIADDDLRAFLAMRRQVL
jgi:excisionase family DNA binding protein